MPFLPFVISGRLSMLQATWLLSFRFYPSHQLVHRRGEVVLLPQVISGEREVAFRNCQ